jgi:hypothetical protein
MPTAGTFDAKLRYATGDAASRVLQVNGTAVQDNLALASTGNYDTYTSVSTTLTLPAGRSTISVIYDGSKGSQGYVNLDEISLTPQP